jgi:hypothetical protein
MKYLHIGSFDFWDIRFTFNKELYFLSWFLICNYKFVHFFNIKLYITSTKSPIRGCLLGMDLVELVELGFQFSVSLFTSFWELESQWVSLFTLKELRTRIWVPQFRCLLQFENWLNWVLHVNWVPWFSSKFIFWLHNLLRRSG